MHQRRKLTLCLVVGVLVLAVSAAAAFGSVNGYDRYKQAVKQLLTQEENLTLQAQVNLTMDGAEVFAWQGTYAKDGADSARTSCTHSGEGEAYREFSTVWDGMRTQFVEDSRLYTQTPAVQTGWADSLLGIQADDEMTQRMVEHPGTGGLAIGAGQCQQLHLSGWVAKKRCAQLAVHPTGVLHQQLIGDFAVLLRHHKDCSLLQRLRHIVVPVAQSSPDTDEHAALLHLAGIAGHRGDLLCGEAVVWQNLCKKCLQLHLFSLFSIVISSHATDRSPDPPAAVVAVLPPGQC